MNRFCITAALALLLLNGRTAGAQTQTGRAMSAETPIRREATLTSAIITTLKEGDHVDVVEMHGDWYRVLVHIAQDKFRAGYVMANQVEIVSTDGSAPATPAIAQGPPIPPTLAQLQRAKAREEALKAEAEAQRQRDAAREESLKAAVDAAEARLKALQGGAPQTQVHTAPVPPAARPSQTREGFWLNGGFGFGSLGCVSCDGHVSGASSGLSLGGTLNDRLLLGFGTTGWYRSKDGVALNAGTLDARLRFYPSTASGFFLTGGVGLGTIRVAANGSGSERETGVGFVLGLGWDVRIRQNMSLTPFWNGSAVRTSNADANFGQFGLGITIH